MDSPAHIKACKKICEFLNITKIPTDITHTAEEFLHLSSLRHKPVSLHSKWYKHNNGVMLGSLKNGTPIALMPGKLTGCRAYDPVRGISYKVDAEAAKDIELHATAIFRTLPAKKLTLRDIAAFVLGENMYKEIAIIVLCGLAASLIRLIPPLMAATIFDMIIPQDLRSMLVEVVLLLFVFAIANIGFSVLINLSVTRIKTKSGLVVSAALWDRLINMPMPFFSRYTSDELLRKVKSIENVKNMVTLENLQSVVSSLFSFVYIIALYSFSVTVTNYVIVMFLVLFAAYYFAGRKKYRLYKKHAEQDVIAEINETDNALKAFHTFFDFISTGVVFLLVVRAGYMEVGAFVAYTAIFFILRLSLGGLMESLNILPRLISQCDNIAPILEAE